MIDTDAEIQDVRKIELSVTPGVVLQLQRLRDTGFYGLSIADAAERVLCRGLEQNPTLMATHGRRHR